MRVLVSVMMFSYPPLAMASSATLVVKEADGSFGPGAATSWVEEDEAVVFRLGPDADGDAIAVLLAERLFNAKVTFAEEELRVAGVPLDALLDQLSRLSVTGEGDVDPLADLAGLGAVVAMDTPEAGGSIRASRPTASGPTLTIKEHDPAERVEAEVLRVEKGPFPSVRLKLRLRSNARAGALRDKLKRGRVYEASVVFTRGSAGIDFSHQATQQNLGAYYLRAGDHVVVHLFHGQDDAIEIDFIERHMR